jgi:hypothetical protein
VIASNGTLQIVSASIPTEGTAACWDVVSSDGRFAIVTNAGASTETLFSVAGNEAAGAISEFRFDESSRSIVKFGSISVGFTPNSGFNGLQAR